VTLDALASAFADLGGEVLGQPEPVVVEFGSHRLYAHPWDIDQYAELNPEEWVSDTLAVVAQAPDSYTCYLLDYSSLAKAEEAVDRVVERWPCVIDDEHGRLMTGREWRSRPTRSSAPS
jgi:hypothetical protein